MLNHGDRVHVYDQHGRIQGRGRDMTTPELEAALKAVSDWMESYNIEPEDILSEHGPTIQRALQNAIATPATAQGVGRIRERIQQYENKLILRPITDLQEQRNHEANIIINTLYCVLDILEGKP